MRVNTSLPLLLVLALYLNGEYVMSDEPQKKKVSIVVVQPGKNEHKDQEGFVVTLRPNGQLYDQLGHQVEDKWFAVTGEKDSTLVIDLFLKSEKDTSVEALTTALTRITAVADPKKETVIYIYFKGLRPG